jgi:hypothetical protein
MAQDAVEQSTLTSFWMSQFVLAPDHEVHLAPDVIGNRVTDPGETIPVHLADKQHVDVARDIVSS